MDWLQNLMGGQNGQGSMLPSILMIVLMIAVFYFLLIRPQKKKEKRLKEMIANLRVGDKVMSIGGIYGKIVKIKDDMFVIESGAGTTKSFIALDRGSISRVISQSDITDDDVASLPDEADTETSDEIDAE